MPKSFSLIQSGFFFGFGENSYSLPVEGQAPYGVRISKNPKSTNHVTLRYNHISLLGVPHDVDAPRGGKRKMVDLKLSLRSITRPSAVLRLIATKLFRIPQKFCRKNYNLDEY